jgi:hypothetical protein
LHQILNLHFWNVSKIASGRRRNIAQSIPVAALACSGTPMARKES